MGQKLEISYGSNKGTLGIVDYQVIIAAQIKRNELTDLELQEICEILNNGGANVKLNNELTRTIILKKYMEQITGFILYSDRSGIDDQRGWDIVERDIASVVEQLEFILRPFI